MFHKVNLAAVGEVTLTGYSYCLYVADVFLCEACGKTYPSLLCLDNHTKCCRAVKRERPYVCPECSNEYTQKSSLTQHSRAHDCKKPFVCTQCGYKSAYKSNLKKHLKIHMGKKPLLCEECSKKFIY